MRRGLSSPLKPGCRAGRDLNLKLRSSNHFMYRQLIYNQPLEGFLGPFST